MILYAISSGAISSTLCSATVTLFPLHYKAMLSINIFAVWVKNIK